MLKITIFKSGLTTIFLQNHFAASTIGRLIKPSEIAEILGPISLITHDGRIIPLDDEDLKNWDLKRSMMQKEALHTLSQLLKMHRIYSLLIMLL